MDVCDFLNPTEIHIKKYKNKDATLYNARWYTCHWFLSHSFLVFREE